MFVLFRLCFVVRTHVSSSCFASESFLAFSTVKAFESDYNDMVPASGCGDQQTASGEVKKMPEPKPNAIQMHHGGAVSVGTRWADLDNGDPLSGGESAIDTPTIEQLCSLPAVRGTGQDDIIRIYYNSLLGECLPFSYSGKFKLQTLCIS